MNVNPPPLLPNAPPFRHLPAGVAIPLARAERKICKRSREELYAFDIRGNEVLYVPGQHPREIELSDEAAALCRDRIVTHNHPNHGGSFSIVDLEFAIKNDVREFRAVDGVRWQFVYSLHRPDGGWPEGFFEEVYDEYRRTLPAVEARHQREVEQGSMSKEDSLYELLHETWERVKGVLGLDYRRIPWSD